MPLDALEEICALNDEYKSGDKEHLMNSFVKRHPTYKVLEDPFTVQQTAGENNYNCSMQQQVRTITIVPCNNCNRYLDPSIETMHAVF